MLLSCGLIGFGYWGPNIARSIMKINGVHLDAICDLDKDNLWQAGLLYPQAYVTDNIEQLLTNPSLDALIIATPASTHFKIATKALNQGKHILIEKPLTINSAEALELEEINLSTKRIIMVGHTFEYNPAVIKIKQLIKENDIGQVFYGYSSRLNLGQIRGDINALWNLAPHDISIFNYLFESNPVEVLATGAICLQKEVEDVVFVTLRYPSGVMAQIHVSWLDPAKIRRMTIVGSKKMLMFDDTDNEMPIKIYDKRANIGEIAKGLITEYNIKLHSGDIYIPQIEHKEPLMEELKHFFECVRENKKPLTDLTNGLNVVKVLEACQKSLKKGNKWVSV